ncbi:MAG: hypothetical protein KDA97_04635, partial [Acidimicrobiales bacterium]|nr:hypothetical protein [Acidimicrobiales bacterium]
PRQELRMALVEGTEITLAITTDLAITQTDEGGRRQRLDSPPITQWITYVVTDVGPDGAAVDLEVAAAFAEPAGTGLDPDAVADLDAALAAVAGTTGTATVTDRGRFTDVAFEAGDGLPEVVADHLDDLGAQVAALGPALPREAVGVGARWEAIATTPYQGTAATTTTTYTVTAIEDGAVSYDAEIELAIEPGDLDLDGLPEGTTARLVGSSGTGTATGTQRLDDLSLELSMQTESAQDLELAEGTGAVRPLAQEVTTATAVRTPDP